VLHRGIALFDFALAVFNIFMAWWMWNWVSFANLLAAVFCIAMGMLSLRLGALRRANQEEEERIQAIRDNWPWN
jgi:uncharacterized membrane protein YidH (DUF202 family)